MYHQKCYGEPKDPEVMQAYHSDTFLLQLRAKNLMDHFFDQYTYAELAKALAPFKPRLAAQIGGIAFERRVRDLAAVFGDNYEKDLKTLIDNLQERGAIMTSRRPVGTKLAEYETERSMEKATPRLTSFTRF